MSKPKRPARVDVSVLVSFDKAIRMLDALVASLIEMCVIDKDAYAKRVKELHDAGARPRDT